ncbi:sulfite oxidase isoform X2 [Brassica napus]|uniref:sulfite oxidase isoform X2 n=1 Tax=Brassica napus TaxID=3708 RepID=UPI0006AAFF42|nr:sulfite oxidase isoform X2 [Brassica napus]
MSPAQCDLSLSLQNVLAYVDLSLHFFSLELSLLLSFHSKATKVLSLTIKSKAKEAFFLVVICKKKEEEDMPGIRGPSEYSQEPPRDPCFKVNAKEPFNAEPPRSALVSSYVTPVHLFYKRNHGPIPIVDHIENYSVAVTGLIDNPKMLFIKDIRSLPKYNVTATLQCAGNRRTAMSKVRNVRGVGWDVSAIAVWGGAKLADVLELLGIPKLTGFTTLGGRHVEFVSVDRCKEENGGPYKASIPLSQATNPDADVLLAYEMNGEILNRDHGFPLRVVVPGVIGARSVKWLDSINLLAEECQGFFMQKDYKMFPPSVNWDNINWSSRRPQMDFPVQSAICSLEDVQMVRPGKVSIKGYAVSGGGRGIERVDISMDGGKSWVEASRTQKPGRDYISEHNSSDKWAWVLFEATFDVSQSTEVIAKAVDSAANVQPENVESVWNLRGVLNTSWHRVLLRLGHSNL